MDSLIQIFRMNELSIQTRVRIMKQLGVAINHEFAANVTEAVVYELVIALDPSNSIKDDEQYKRYLKD